MAKKKLPKMTAEELAELAERAETHRLAQERIAYHAAKARDEEKRRGRGAA